MTKGSPLAVRPQPDLALAARLLGHGLHQAARGGKAEPHHLDRKREFAEHRHELGVVGDHHHLVGGGGHDLLAEQRPSTALDQAELIVDLVGAVDSQVQMRRLVEGGERNAEAFGAFPRGLGGGHAQDLQTAGHLLCERIDEPLRRRSRAEPEPHAVEDEIERAQGRGLL